MRVIHLNLERGWRGGERQVELLVRELAEFPVEQTVLGRGKGLLVERLRDLAAAEVVGFKNRIGAWRYLLTRSGPSVIHAHTGNTAPIAILGRGHNDRVVVTRRLDLPASRFWLRRADRVVAISESVERSLERAGLDTKRIIRIPSGIDRKRKLDPEFRYQLRNEIGVPVEATLGLTIAALESQKDPLTLARAFAYLPWNYHHIWVGDGSLRGDLDNLILSMGIQGRFHLAGFDPESDHWHAAADVFILPSVHEGLGTALLDAFHFGLPVLGTRIPGTAELLQENSTALLFDPGDAKGLADGVGNLLNDASLKERIIEGGRRRVEGYDIKATARAYMDLYEELLTGP